MTRRKLQSIALNGIGAALVACLVALAILPFSVVVSQAILTVALAVGVLSAVVGAVAD